MKSSLGYFLWEYVAVEEDSVRMAIYWWYTPPAAEADLRALDLAAERLADSTSWHQEDDRDCDDDAETGRWSLFCALKASSIEAMGEYNHHNTAMQTVRFLIGDMFPGREFEHTLMDYNNLPGTTHADVLTLLARAREQVAAELAESGSGR